MNDKIEGKIVFYNSAKEYGFIRADGTDGSEMGKDVFFHLSQYDCDGDPVLDARVAFQVEDDPQKPGQQRAKTVIPI